MLRLYGTYQTPHQLVMVTEPLNYGDLWNVIYEVTPYCEQDGTHALTHSLTHSLTYSPTHSLTHSLTYSLTHSLTYSLTDWLTEWLTHSLTYSLTHSLGISLPLATFYIASLVIALAHIHGHGVVFRDLKPENILLDGNGYIRIIDFGFAKKVTTHSPTYSLTNLLTHSL